MSRVEQGETIEVPRHGHVVAVFIPPPRQQSRFDELVVQGAARPAERDLTTRNLDQYTRIEVPEDVDPLAILLEMRENER
ncbi:hypothetical protein FPZ12_023030 [Amycolatopsis acidicola]|uniref:Antitoxin n=1 Tax=Amycolatopsis acidicola TaxID=2596893 RepID=A0A5N0V1V3_9PSEU|nr:hypothetical protein [Amycolatopsis acidicola]KAA9158220.1 hypothetical protein FPZ12_023030 [Amycolatopsis acidicola]